MESRVMRILVNALSATNASGRHVLLGHLSRLAKWTAGEHEYFALYHTRNADLRRNMGKNVHWVRCPSYTSQWPGRTAWERIALPGLVKKLKADFLFMPSGVVSHGCPVPQVSFAQNPWCLVKGIERTPAGSLKAAIQRREYRKAMKEAAMMVFNSEYMRAAYRENAGLDARHSYVVYQGINDSVFEAAAGAKAAKKENTILCVSVMAPHKAVETVVRALDRLTRFYGLPAKLSLVGPWSDRPYEKKIKKLIGSLKMDRHVTITGLVTREELNRSYAESSVFCLMSRCESFGIPGIEAQAFGTPVVSSNCCAIPEVCGAGGVYPHHDDVEAVSSALYTLLTDRTEWERLSAAAVANASRFSWDLCSRPLLSMFDIISGEALAGVSSEGA